MLITATSDIHGFPPISSRQKKSSEIDTLILAGDIADHDVWNNFTFLNHGKEVPGYEIIKHNASWNFRKIDAEAEAKYQLKWAEEKLAPWVKNLKPKHVIWVNGNHDFLDPTQLSFVTHGLKTGSANVTIEGVKIGLLAGSMPFNGEWSDEVDENEMKARIEALDNDIQILVSHVPPYGILDKAYSGDRIGCNELVKAITGYEPKFTNLRHHFFGHVHEESGDAKLMDIHFYNLSNRVVEFVI